MFDWVTIPLVYTQVGYEFLSAITFDELLLIMTYCCVVAQLLWIWISDLELAGSIHGRSALDCSFWAALFLILFFLIFSFLSRALD